MRKRFWKGLRAIEIVIVLAAIFIVLAVVATRYPDFKCRSMQSEAKFSLQEIYAGQDYFHTEHNHYATIERLLVNEGRIKIPQRYYTFADGKTPTDEVFLVRAVGREGTLVAGEEWSVDHNKNIQIITNACRN